MLPHSSKKHTKLSHRAVTKNWWTVFGESSENTVMYFTVLIMLECHNLEFYNSQKEKKNSSSQYLIKLIGNCVWSHCYMRTAVLPFSRRLRSSPLWRTICGPWCHWLRSSGCRNVLLDPPEADFSTDPSSQSWSGRGIVPRRKETFFFTS